MARRRASKLSAGPFQARARDVGESASLHALINILGVKSIDVAREVGLTRGRIAHFLNPAEHVPLSRRQDFIDLLRDTIRNTEEAYDRFESDNQGRELPHWKEQLLEAIPPYRDLLAVCQRILEADEALLQTELKASGAKDK